MEGRTHQGSDKGEVVIHYGCHVRKMVAAAISEKHASIPMFRRGLNEKLNTRSLNLSDYRDSFC
jgi:hypothetical protein